MIQTGDNITIHLVGKLEDGTVFVDTRREEPIEIVVGNYNLVKGLNREAIGLGVGDEKEFTLPPEDAYGFHNEELVIKVPCERLPEGAMVGMQLQSSDNILWRILEISRDNTIATLDGNHILVDRSLNFWIKILAIQS